MFEAWKKGLADTANAEEEEIQFRPLDTSSGAISFEDPELSIVK